MTVDDSGRRSANFPMHACVHPQPGRIVLAPPLIIIRRYVARIVIRPQGSPKSAAIHKYRGRGSCFLGEGGVRPFRRNTTAENRFVLVARVYCAFAPGSWRIIMRPYCRRRSATLYVIRACQNDKCPKRAPIHQ